MIIFNKKRMNPLENIEFGNIELIELNELDLVSIDAGAGISDSVVRFLTWCGDTLSSMKASPHYVAAYHTQFG
jgi:hypothetical protein